MLSIAPPAPKLSPRSGAAPSPSTSGGHGKPRLRHAPSATAPTTWKTTHSGHKPTYEQPRRHTSEHLPHLHPRHPHPAGQQVRDSHRGHVRSEPELEAVARNNVPRTHRMDGNV